MSETIFKCHRCGYENGSLRLFKQHLERIRECKPKESDIPLQEVKKQYQELLEKKEKSSTTTASSSSKTCDRTDTPERKRKSKRTLRIFGNENLDYLSKATIIKYINDPLKGIQDIIKLIYFDKEHGENHTVKWITTTDDVKSQVEIYTEDGWTRARTKRVFTKMIYRASDILEYNIPKKHWTNEFRNFIEGMGELDNDELLSLIIEETGDTVVKSMQNIEIAEPSSA